MLAARKLQVKEDQLTGRKLQEEYHQEGMVKSSFPDKDKDED